MSSAVGHRVALVLATVAAVGGCGGSHRRLARHSPTGAAARSAVSFPSASNLPVSPGGPITCTVYEPGLATQVIFDSRRFDVRVECRQWSRGSAGEGYLWGYESTSANAAGSTQACRMVNIEGNVTARVIEATGFARVSEPERASARSACASILASGWSVVGRHHRMQAG